jgi:phosphoribosylglycinamide formyltransferase-1
VAESLPPMSSKRIAVLISGRGSNLQALIDAIARGDLDATIVTVVSNRHDAEGLQRARAAGIEALYINPRQFDGREAYDVAIATALVARKVILVCLAGYMRLVGPALLTAFPNRIVNIHPSLLPAFPGLHAQEQAVQHGVRVSGATVHLVNGELDAGPIVLQRAVTVESGDTAETLADRILVQEHRLYPEAVRLLLDGRWHIDGRRLVVS